FTTECAHCSRLSRFLLEVKHDYPQYRCLPVPSFGDADARLLIVGLAPGMHGANATGRPFTGDHAGILLYQTLHRFDFASRDKSVAADDGLLLKDCRITNAVRCLPPQNKPTGAEINHCNGYLQQELAQMPPDAVVMALGVVAHRAVIRAMGLRQNRFPFAHGAEHRLAPGVLLVDSYHCSRYNTNTKRLTPGMFEAVFAQIRSHLK
ncbi:MAG: uracil-DNA glycosylase, partial [Pseudomonadota bacterium]